MAWLEIIGATILLGAIIGLNGWVLFNPDGNKRSESTPDSKE